MITLRVAKACYEGLGGQPCPYQYLLTPCAMISRHICPFGKPIAAQIYRRCASLLIPGLFSPSSCLPDHQRGGLSRSSIQVPSSRAANKLLVVPMGCQWAVVSTVAAILISTGRLINSHAYGYLDLSLPRRKRLWTRVPIHNPGPLSVYTHNPGRDLLPNMTLLITGP